MRMIGCLLMISGWLLMLAALLLLSATGPRTSFVAAALLVELLGLGLIAQHYRGLLQGPQERGSR